MREFEDKQEQTLKYKSGKTSMATTAVLENWEPATILCPKCGEVFAPHVNYCMNCTQPKAPNIVYSVQPIKSGDDWYRENFVSTVGNKRTDYSIWQEKELKKENINGNK